MSTQSAALSPSSHLRHLALICCSSLFECDLPPRCPLAGRTERASMKYSVHANWSPWTATWLKALVTQSLHKAFAPDGTCFRVTILLLQAVSTDGYPDGIGRSPAATTTGADMAGRHLGQASPKRLDTSLEHTLQMFNLIPSRTLPGTSPDNLPDACSCKCKRSPAVDVQPACLKWSPAGQVGIGQWIRGGGSTVDGPTASPAALDRSCCCWRCCPAPSALLALLLLVLASAAALRWGASVPQL